MQLKGLHAIERGPASVTGPSVSLTGPSLPLTDPRFPLWGPVAINGLVVQLSVTVPGFELHRSGAR